MRTKTDENMDAKQLWQLEKLGVNLEQSTIDIFANVLDLAEYLYDELSIQEEDRLRIELNRLKKPTN
ncbi:MAG TPA: hypothetical protein VLA48_03405 [Nitrososphaeraceae archaeon]|nr:hypothetical protein [Nitrososphaeraceae archaeon]